MADVFQNIGNIEQWLQGIATNLGAMLTDFANGEFTIVVSPVNSSTFASGQVACATNATQIIASNASRKYLLIKNIGANPIFIGPSTVTTANGYSLAAGATLEMKESVTTAAIYGRVAAATETACYVEW